MTEQLADSTHHRLRAFVRRVVGNERLTGRKIARSVASGEIDGAPPGLVATKSRSTTSAFDSCQAPTDEEDGQRERPGHSGQREAEMQSVRGGCPKAQAGEGEMRMSSRSGIPDVAVPGAPSGCCQRYADRNRRCTII